MERIKRNLTYLQISDGEKNSPGTYIGPEASTLQDADRAIVSPQKKKGRIKCHPEGTYEDKSIRVPRRLHTLLTYEKARLSRETNTTLNFSDIILNLFKLHLSKYEKEVYSMYKSWDLID